MFFEKFVGTFDTLFEVLGDGLLAAYLLATRQLSDVTSQTSQASQFADPVELSFDIPPREAIEYFRAKRVVTRKEFDKLFVEAREAAFTVGGIYRDDVLEAFKEEIAQALEQGTPQREVIKKFRSILDGAGHRRLGEFHLETIFRTNIQMAYGVGRRRGLEEVADDLPFWQYSAVLDDRSRPTHRALDGVVLPASHPFWNSHYPPWDFMCRCTVIALASPPAGYDPSNPSGEAQLSYGKDGSPAKAEWGTAVYDLSAGRFQGVPVQGGLKETVEGASRRARANRKK